jgi:hypothetical protein
MNFAKVGFIAVALAATGASAGIEAFACTPSPGVTYDNELKDPTALVVTATVTQFEITADKTIICLRTHYSVREVLVGSHVGPLQVSVCYLGSSDNPEKLRSEKEGLKEFFGFVEGAFVFAAMTKAPPINTSPQISPEHAGEFRYLYPTCWGLAHYDLGHVSEQERNDFLAEYRAKVRKGSWD